MATSPSKTPMPIMNKLPILHSSLLHSSLLTLLPLGFALLGSPAIAADTPDQYALRMEVHTASAAPFYRLNVPLAAYEASTHGDLLDLRIFNAAGTAVPYARLAPSGSTEEEIQRSSVRWFPIRAAARQENGAPLKMVVRQSGDGTLVSLESGHTTPAKTATQAPVRGYVVDVSQLRERQSIRALQLNWAGSASDFQLIDVEASDDLQHWTALASGVQLARLDYNGARIENRRIELPGLSGRYLRLLWREPDTAPELSAAEIEQSTARYLPPPLAWSAALTPVSGDSTKPGEYRYHLPRPLPLARLQMTLPPGNQLLPVQILTQSGHQQGWQSIASSVVYRINSKGREWSNTDVMLGNVIVQDFMLRLDPRLPAPPQAPALRYAVQPTQLVFLASGTPPYTLAAGNRDARDATLPVSTLVPGFGQPNSPEIAEAETSAPAGAAPAQGAQAGGSAPANPESRKYLLWGVLVLGVLGMAAMAWQLLRQMKQTPTDKR